MKNKIFITSLIVCMTALILAGATTLAYFTDLKQSTNTFTAGGVYIELSEAAVVRDSSGNLVADHSAPRVKGSETGTVHDYGIIRPGQVIDKDPTIRNTGNEDAWIAAKVTLKDGAGSLYRIMGYPNSHNIDIEILLGGGLLDQKVHVGSWNGFENVCYNENYAMVQVSTANADEYVFYFFILNKVAPGSSVVIFDNLTVPAEWNNDEMQELADFDIDIKAFAVQTFGFNSCYDAMTEAFEDHFDLN